MQDKAKNCSKKRKFNPKFQSDKKSKRLFLNLILVAYNTFYPYSQRVICVSRSIQFVGRRPLIQSGQRTDGAVFAAVLFHLIGMDGRIRVSLLNL